MASRVRRSILFVSGCGRRASLGCTVAMSLAAVALGGCGGGTARVAAGVKGSSEVAAVPISTVGANPFTAKVGNDMAGVMPPAGAVSPSGGPPTYSADLPGLYGGTRNHATCDATKLVDFLEQNPAKASAWATTIGIQTTQIRDYVSGLTPVLLRTDTRVTNHGYVNGVADPIQSVLEAGTAVFVNKYGEPVVKCYCGNPLTPPVLYTEPVYTGPLWTGFSTTHITIINQSTTIINVFKLYDPSNGRIFPRSPGGRDGPYINVVTPPTGTVTGGQSTTPSPSAPGSSPAPSAPRPAPPATSENPSVSLSPNPVTQGDTVTLTASGFAPNTTLQITVNRPDGVVEHYPMSTSSDGSGSYTFSNAAGNAPLGTYGVTVTNLSTGARASGSVDVVAPPASSGSPTTT